MIEFYIPDKTGHVEKRAELVKNCWVRVVDPNEEEIERLVSEFGLDKSNIDDALDIYENPRIEEDNGVVYFFIRVPIAEGSNHTTTLMCAMTKRNIITVSKHDLNLIYQLKQHFRRRTNPRPEKYLLIFLSDILKRYNLEAKSIIKEVRGRKSFIARLTHKDILDLVNKEDKLNDYLYSFTPVTSLTKQLSRLKSLKLTEEDKELIEDLLIDLDQTETNCRTTLKTITNMRNYYATTLTNDTNRIITVFTIFTIFLTIPTLISSIYGMNIDLPLQNSPYVLSVLAGVVAVIYLIMLYFLKRNRILDV